MTNETKAPDSTPTVANPVLTTPTHEILNGPSQWELFFKNLLADLGFAVFERASRFTIRALAQGSQEQDAPWFACGLFLIGGYMPPNKSFSFVFQDQFLRLVIADYNPNTRSGSFRYVVDQSEEWCFFHRLKRGFPPQKTP